MPKRILAACLVSLIPLLAPSSRAYSQTSVNVTTLDPVYRDIDKLVGQGLVDKIIVGQRPYSRKEIARITAEAMKNLSRLEEKRNDPQLSEKQKASLQSRLTYVNSILDRLKKDYGEELVELGALEGEKSWYSAHPVEKVDVDVTLAKSPAEALPASNGLGNIDAVINPLLNNRQGRHLVDGYNLSLETNHWVRATNYFAFLVSPRFQLAIGRGNQPNDNNAYINNLYGKFYIKNFEVEVGRDNLVWGQGLHSGLLLSDNARGLDMVKLSNDSPFFLPWVFRFLGPVKFSFFYSDMGPEQFFPHSYLTGFKLSFEPASFFEFGLSGVDESGGDGSPSGSFGTRVGNVFPLVQLFTGHQNQIDNKIGGADVRFRIPPARGLELYAEAIFDDTPGTVAKKFFWDDAGYIFGVYAPRLTNSGNVDLRLEWNKTGIRMYRHPQFQSGWTLNRFIVGDSLGPDAQGGYATLNWDIDRKNLLTFKGDVEWRSEDIYEGISDPGLHFVKTVNNPKETRYAFMTEWLHRLDGLPLFFKVQLGYEYVRNFGFTSGDNRSNFLGQLGLQVNFDRWTHFPRPK